MIDHDGTEWLPVSEAARAARVRESAIYVWIQRRKVRSHKIGRRAHVSMVDVMAAEHAWRKRVVAQSSAE